MTTAVEQQVLERLKQLPPERVAQVVDFVEFLALREELAAAARRLADGLHRIDALALPPISEDEIEHEVQSSRKERRERSGV